MYGSTLPLLLAGAGSALAALQVDFASTSSIKAAAKDVAFDVMSYYKGNQTGHILGLMDSPPPTGSYYWWTNGIVWSTMIDYWHYTGDETYNAVTAEGLIAQSGDDLAHVFLPRNWTLSIANDDQGFWGMAAMQAAELGFPSPPQGKPSWIDLAKAVFDIQAARYSLEQVCNGGLRWTLTPASNGYDIKDAGSTAGFLNLGARLYRLTNNETYAEWVEKSWDWLSGVGLIDDKFNVYESVNTVTNCSAVSKLQASSTATVLLQAAAYMYNHTTDSAKSQLWSTRLTGLANQTITIFFPNGTLVERACERADDTTCTSDGLFMKGIALRSLASAAALVPGLLAEAPISRLLRALRATAGAAAATCEGGLRGRECGYRWADAEPVGDKIVGLPAEVDALAAVVGMLLGDASPLNGTAGQGGDGSGNGGSGSGSGSGSDGSGGGSGGQSGTGDKGNAGASTRAAMGLVLAGLVAALF